MSMPILHQINAAESRRAADQVWNWLIGAPFSIGKLPEPLLHDLVEACTTICTEELRDARTELSRLPQFRHHQIEPGTQLISRVTDSTAPVIASVNPHPAQSLHPEQPKHETGTQEGTAESGNTAPQADSSQTPEPLTGLMLGENDHLPLEEWRVQMRGMIRAMTAGKRRSPEVNTANEAAEVALEVQRFERQEGAAALGQIALQSGQMQVIQTMHRIKPDNIRAFVNREITLNFSPRTIIDAFIAMALATPDSPFRAHPLIGERPTLNEVQPTTQPLQSREHTELSRRILTVRSMLNQHFVNSYNALQSLGKHQGRLNINLRDAIEHIWHTRHQGGITLPTAREVDGVELLIQRWLSEQQRRSISRQPAAPVTAKARPSQKDADVQTEGTSISQDELPAVKVEPSPATPATFSQILKRHLAELRRNDTGPVITPVSSFSGIKQLESRTREHEAPQEGRVVPALAPHAEEKAETQTEEDSTVLSEAVIQAPVEPDPMLAFIAPNLFAGTQPAATPTPPQNSRKARRGTSAKRPAMVTIRNGTHSHDGHPVESTRTRELPEPQITIPEISTPEISTDERIAISERREEAKQLIHEMETYLDLEHLQIRLHAESIIPEGAEGHRTLKLWRNGSMVPGPDELLLLNMAAEIIREEYTQTTETQPLDILDLMETEQPGETDLFAFDPKAPTSRRKREEYILNILDEHGPQSYNKLCRRLGVSPGKMIEITKQITGIICQGDIIQRRER